MYTKNIVVLVVSHTDFAFSLVKRGFGITQGVSRFFGEITRWIAMPNFKKLGLDTEFI